MFRWTTKSLFLLTAGCSLPLATWVLLGRPHGLLAIGTAACFLCGPLLYGLATPTPASWRTTGQDLTEQQPILMGIGIITIALGTLMAAALFTRVAVFTPSKYPWPLVLCALVGSGWVLGLAGGAIARFQSAQLERHLAKHQRRELGP